MTAEIAIMNRNAVALAADSAGTLLLPTGPKITSTYSKLFMLSRYAPVGIMVYGLSELMGIPWDTIIKTYSRDLKTRAFEHLEDYASDFLHFLEREELLFPRDLQSSYADLCLENGFERLRASIGTEIDRVISSSGSIDDLHVENLVREQSLQFLSEVEQKEYLFGFGPDDVNRFARESETAIEQVLQRVFQRLPIAACSKQLLRAGALMLCNKYLNLNFSGIVIAGFGEQDFFPVLLHFECDGVIHKKLRYIKKDEVRIGPELTGAITGSIRPFAQHEMVDRFMEGIDGIYRKFVEDKVWALLSEEYPKQIATALSGKISCDHQNGLSAQLGTFARELMTGFAETLDQFQQEKFIRGILDSVATLPTADLAAMAEALVNLTAFKLKVTVDEAETVSSPIDVAVISKGEGFVWIKKKQYFDASLNPDVLRNYCRKEER